MGKIWTWALEGSTGTNSMFSISNGEFRTILREFIKINPFSARKGRIFQPYPYHEFNIVDKLHYQDGMPKYEFTIMALLNAEFARMRIQIYSEIIQTIYAMFLQTSEKKWILY